MNMSFNCARSWRHGAGGNVCSPALWITGMIELGREKGIIVISTAHAFKILCFVLLGTSWYVASRTRGTRIQITTARGSTSTRLGLCFGVVFIRELGDLKLAHYLSRLLIIEMTGILE